MNPYEKILKSLQIKYFLAKALENLLLLLTVVLMLFICTNFVIKVFYDSFSILKPITIIFKSLCLAVILFYIFRSILSFHSRIFIANKISNIFPQHNEVFLSSIELEKSKSTLIHRGYSNEIIDANIQLANKLAKEINASSIINYKNLLKAAKTFIFFLTIILLTFLFDKASFRTSYLAMTSLEQFAPQYDDEILISPGNVLILKGHNQKITIENFYPEFNYALHYGLNRRWKSVELQKDNYTFFNIADSIQYYVTNDFAVSDTFLINVLEKPTIQNLTVYYRFPAYSKLPNKIEKDASGNIIALKGSKIKLKIQVNNQLSKYRIIFSDGRTKMLEKLDDYKYMTTFTVEKSMSYHFYLKDILNNQNQSVERTVYVEEDFPPRVEILSPAEDRILSQNLTEDISYIASDDFGISDLLIVFKKNNEKYDSVSIISEEMEQTALKSIYTFDVNDRNLLPGDVICYYLLVYDNCTFPEMQSAKSKIYLLKFPSIEELYEEIQKEQKGKYQNLSDNLEQVKKTKEKFDELRRKFLKKEEFDWEEKEDLKSVLKKQSELAQKAEQTAKEYEKFIEQIEENKVVSHETLEKLHQIQEIMEEIATPELKEALKKLQESMQNITPQEMKKALENFKFSQEEFLKRLEETLKLLKSIQLEQEMQKCLQQAEELEKLQKDLNTKTKNQIDENQNLDELSKEQKDISEKYENLHKNLEDLINELAENNEQMAAQKLQNALSDMEKNNLSENIQNAEKKMEENDFQNLSSMQNNISQSFFQLKQSIQSAQSMMQSAMQQKVLEMIEKTLFEILYFSENQEKILHNKYTAFDILDYEIAIYDGIKNSVNQLYSIPQIMLVLNPRFSMHTAETLNKFEQMFEQIKNRRNYNVQENKQEIYTSINKMIIDLLQSQQQMGQGGGGMQNLLQQLQQMTQGQSSLNLLTQGLFEQMMMQQAQGLTQEQRNMVSRIAADEQQIKENLERVLRDFPETEKLLGNLENIKEEIEEVIKKLDKGIIDRQLMEQQNRILSRLLDVQKSVHRRDYSRKRESKTPDEEQFPIPDTLKIEKEFIQIKDILKFINENYPEEYHRLIKDYLERIHNEN